MHLLDDTHRFDEGRRESVVFDNLHRQEASFLMLLHWVKMGGGSRWAHVSFMSH